MRQAPSNCSPFHGTDGPLTLSDDGSHLQAPTLPLSAPGDLRATAAVLLHLRHGVSVVACFLAESLQWPGIRRSHVPVRGQAAAPEIIVQLPVSCSWVEILLIRAYDGI